MDDLGYWLGFNLIPQIGPVRLRALLESFGDLGRAWQASGADLRAAGLGQAAVEQLLYHRGRIDLNAELAKVEAQGVKLVNWQSSAYPARLLEIDHPPALLYVKGDLIPNDEWALAVVGTRSPTSYGKETARRLAAGLAENGITVVSGLALGIDGVAHRAALDAKGRTIAVMGCGLDEIYPSRHRDLAQRVIQNGALVSDYPLGTRPAAGNFPPRNRIISGLSLGSLVVEAGERSGALITLHFALEHGRETFAVPGNIHSRMSAGANRAIQRGEAKLVTSVEDILEELNLSVVVQQKEVRSVLPENPTEASLLSCLDAEPTYIDDIVRQSGLSTAEVSSALCLMELKGMVSRVDGMAYALKR